MEPRIAGFEVLAPLGSGAMSTVWRARELKSGQAVIARPGEAHGVRNAGEQDLVLLVFMTPKP